jgi:hypothetical protein
MVKIRKGADRRTELTIIMDCMAMRTSGADGLNGLVHHHGPRFR